MRDPDVRARWEAANPDSVAAKRSVRWIVRYPNCLGTDSKRGIEARTRMGGRRATGEEINKTCYIQRKKLLRINQTKRREALRTTINRPKAHTKWMHPTEH